MKASPVPLRVTGSLGVQQTQLASALSRQDAQLRHRGRSARLVQTTMRGPVARTAAAAASASSMLAICRSGEPGELELVRGDDVGRRHGVVAEELGDARPDEKAAALVTHDRVAGVEHARPLRADARHGARDRLAQVRSPR